MTALGCFADVVDDDNVGMVEGGCRACLAEKAVDGHAALALRVVHHLDGNRTLEPRVDGAKYFAHPTAADQLLDAVVLNCG